MSYSVSRLKNRVPNMYWNCFRVNCVQVLEALLHFILFCSVISKELLPLERVVASAWFPLVGWDSSVLFTQLCLTLCGPMNRSMPGLLVHHQLPESTQTHVHWVGDAIQPSHPLSSLLLRLNLSQHQGLFKWVSSLHQVAEVLEFQLQHQSFQWTPRTDLI